jgi:hypothetical protein
VETKSCWICAKSDDISTIVYLIPGGAEEMKDVVEGIYISPKGSAAM